MKTLTTILANRMKVKLKIQVTSVLWKRNHWTKYIILPLAKYVYCYTYSWNNYKYYMVVMNGDALREMPSWHTPKLFQFIQVKPDHGWHTLEDMKEIEVHS